MKKIALMLTLAMLLSMAVANAEITRGKDTFTNDIRISSVSNEVPSLQWIGFYKILGNNSIRQEIRVAAYSYPYRLFSSDYAELKIDEGPIYKLSVSNSKFTPITNTKIYIFSTLEVKDEIAEKIRDAKRIELRLYRDNGSSFVMILPDNVLAEWKEVIALEK